MLSKKELGNYLKKIRTSKKLSLREVDKNMIENGKRNVTPALLRNLANLYNINYLDLYKKAGYIDLIKDVEKDGYISNIPILETIKCNYDYLSQENWIGTINVDEKLANYGKLFALKVHDNSMSPVLIEDDILIIKKQNDFETGDIVVATINEHETIIRKGKKNGTNILLQPLNPNYEPLIYTKDETKSVPVTIIGIVKQLQREF